MDCVTRWVHKQSRTHTCSRLPPPLGFFPFKFVLYITDHPESESFSTIISLSFSSGAFLTSFAYISHSSCEAQSLCRLCPFDSLMPFLSPRRYTENYQHLSLSGSRTKFMPSTTRKKEEEKEEEKNSHRKEFDDFTVDNNFLLNIVGEDYKKTSSVLIRRQCCCRPTTQQRKEGRKKRRERKKKVNGHHRTGIKNSGRH